MCCPRFISWHTRIIKKFFFGCLKRSPVIFQGAALSLRNKNQTEETVKQVYSNKEGVSKQLAAFDFYHMVGYLLYSPRNWKYDTTLFTSFNKLINHFLTRSLCCQHFYLLTNLNAAIHRIFSKLCKTFNYTYFFRRHDEQTMDLNSKK